MYRDPDEPTSELYRLMPPRRARSEIREALDAATGRDRAGPGAGEAVPPVGQETGGTGARRTGSWLRPFVGSALANAAGTILAAIVIATVSYLFAHYVGHAPSRHQPLTRPSATAVHS
jgi:hypothetical protein